LRRDRNAGKERWNNGIVEAPKYKSQLSNKPQIPMTENPIQNTLQPYISFLVTIVPL
jgi:hypothetical protein